TTISPRPTTAPPQGLTPTGDASVTSGAGWANGSLDVKLSERPLSAMPRSRRRLLRRASAAGLRATAPASSSRRTAPAGPAAAAPTGVSTSARAGAAITPSARTQASRRTPRAYPGPLGNAWLGRRAVGAALLRLGARGLGAVALGARPVVVLAELVG